MERARRLRKGAEFDTVYREGTVVSGPLLVIRYRENGQGLVRWGFAIGKRLSQQATVRNRLKRRLREAARPLKVLDGYDVIVTARQGAVEASFDELRRGLEGGLARAGLVEAAGKG